MVKKEEVEFVNAAQEDSMKVNGNDKSERFYRVEVIPEDNQSETDALLASQRVWSGTKYGDAIVYVYAGKRVAGPDVPYEGLPNPPKTVSDVKVLNAESTDSSAFKTDSVDVTFKRKVDPEAKGTITIPKLSDVLGFPVVSKVPTIYDYELKMPFVIRRVKKEYLIGEFSTIYELAMREYQLAEKIYDDMRQLWVPKKVSLSAEGNVKFYDKVDPTAFLGDPYGKADKIIGKNGNGVGDSDERSALSENIVDIRNAIPDFPSVKLREEVPIRVEFGPIYDLMYTDMVRDIKDRLVNLQEMRETLNDYIQYTSTEQVQFPDLRGGWADAKSVVIRRFDPWFHAMGLAMSDKYLRTVIDMLMEDVRSDAMISSIEVKLDRVKFNNILTSVEQSNNLNKAYLSEATNMQPDDYESLLRALVIWPLFPHTTRVNLEIAGGRMDAYSSSVTSLPILIFIMHLFPRTMFNDITQHNLILLLIKFLHNLNNGWISVSAIDQLLNVNALVDLITNSTCPNVIKALVMNFQNSNINYEQTTTTFGVDPNSPFNQALHGKIPGSYRDYANLRKRLIGDAITEIEIRAAWEQRAVEMREIARPTMANVKRDSIFYPVRDVPVKVFDNTKTSHSMLHWMSTLNAKYRCHPMACGLQEDEVEKLGLYNRFMDINVSFRSFNIVLGYTNFMDEGTFTLQPLLYGRIMEHFDFMASLHSVFENAAVAYERDSIIFKEILPLDQFVQTTRNDRQLIMHGITAAKKLNRFDERCTPALDAVLNSTGFKFSAIWQHFMTVEDGTKYVMSHEIREKNSRVAKILDFIRKEGMPFGIFRSFSIMHGLKTMYTPRYDSWIYGPHTYDLGAERRDESYREANTTRAPPKSFIGLPYETRENVAYVEPTALYDDMNVDDTAHRQLEELTVDDAVQVELPIRCFVDISTDISKMTYGVSDLPYEEVTVEDLTYKRVRTKTVSMTIYLDDTKYKKIWYPYKRYIGLHVVPYGYTQFFRLYDSLAWIKDATYRMIERQILMPENILVSSKDEFAIMNARVQHLQKNVLLFQNQ
jgi:hypothetical protein